ncbi:hypothetical protein [Bradyrhizobium sp. Arg816]|uniref:hypothetical protein n=1 Tax=Bradyrhizobium sp. Arg816 TaxID=2998491 RepID=UPI00249F717B|nr:hypothetical protein [Bradyrhizobium sp. Arg816]MDI3567120.1 hypothetical protein [Bradyrhizobium sp. Arg816]
MDNAVARHITEGQLQIDQDEKTFTAKMIFVWTCNEGIKEQACRAGNADHGPNGLRPAEAASADAVRPRLSLLGVHKNGFDLVKMEPNVSPISVRVCSPQIQFKRHFEMLKALLVVCGSGLVISLIAAAYGLDLSAGVF